MPRTPLEAYAFDARFGKRSVFILDPRLTPYPYPPCFSCSHLFASRRHHKQYIMLFDILKFYHDSDAFWSFFYIWFGLLCAKFSNALLGIAKQWSHEKFAILTLKPQSH